MPVNAPQAVSPRVAVVAFLRLARDKWHLNYDQMGALLGVAPRTVRRYTEESVPEACDKSLRERISHLINLWGTLRSFYRTEEGAMGWLTSENDAFGGDAPMTRMLAGNVSDIIAVRNEAEFGINS